MSSGDEHQIPGGCGYYHDPGVRCHPLDPSNDPACDPSIRDHGIACKTIFDCTVPYDQKHRFVRARFMEVEPERWLNGQES